MTRSGGALECGRVEAASVTGVSLARWLRRGRPTWRGAFDGAKRERGPIADREPLPPPLPVAKHRGVEGAAAVVRLAVFGA